MSNQPRIPAFASPFLDDKGNVSKDWFQYLQFIGNSLVQPFANTTLTGSVATYLTSPRNGEAVISYAFLTNKTGAPITVSVYNVPAGGTAGPGNVVINARSIGAGNSYACPELCGLSLNRGSTLQAVGNGVSIVVSGTVSQ